MALDKNVVKKIVALVAEAKASGDKETARELMLIAKKLMGQTKTTISSPAAEKRTLKYGKNTYSGGRC